MTLRLIGIATAIFLTSSCAYAQINALGGATANSGIGGVVTPNSGIGTTSPLGLSTSGTAVAPTGIPLGATPLATPGVSSGASNGVASGTACSPTSMGSAMAGTSGSAALFDNSGVGIMTGATLPGSAAPVTTTCGPASATGGATSLQSSTSTPATSRPGIPMGSTGLSNPGLSPAPCPATGNTAQSTSSGAC
jgi:hypothetical protein